MIFITTSQYQWKLYCRAQFLPTLFFESLLHHSRRTVLSGCMLALLELKDRCWIAQRGQARSIGAPMVLGI